MIASASLHSEQLAHAPAALPQCHHSRLHIGLDAAYCPDCKHSFGPRTEEYKACLEPRPTIVPTLSAQSTQSEEFRVQDKPETTKTRTLSLEDLIRAAYQLDREDLRSLSSAITGLLQALEPEIRVEDGAGSSKSRTLSLERSGSFELKKINKCGPYLYLRWWSGGRHRSTYIGKPKND